MLEYLRQPNPTDGCKCRRNQTAKPTSTPRESTAHTVYWASLYLCIYNHLISWSSLILYLMGISVSTLAISFLDAIQIIYCLYLQTGFNSALYQLATASLLAGVLVLTELLEDSWRFDGFQSWGYPKKLGWFWGFPHGLESSKPQMIQIAD